MDEKRSVTDADLLDYFEGRMTASQRAAVALKLAGCPRLARHSAALRERMMGLRLLRPALLGDRLPDDWLALVAQIGRD